MTEIDDSGDADPGPDDEPSVRLLTEIELTDMETLVPYANNPKRHPPEQIAQIADSIRRFGMDQPIVIDGEGTIIKGHGRYAAARELGLATVPVIWRDGLSPPEVTGARIADNQTQLDTGFDYDLLSTEVQAIVQALGDDRPAMLIGFDPPDIKDLLTRNGGTMARLFDGPRHASTSKGDHDDQGFGQNAGSDGESPISVGGGDRPTYQVRCPDCGHRFEDHLYPADPPAEGSE